MPDYPPYPEIGSAPYKFQFEFRFVVELMYYTETVYTNFNQPDSELDVNILRGTDLLSRFKIKKCVTFMAVHALALDELEEVSEMIDEDLPDFIRDALQQNLCRSCLMTDLIAGLLIKYKPHLRDIFRVKSPRLQQNFIKKLEAAEQNLTKNSSVCENCKKYEDKGLEIQSTITHQDRLQQVRELLKQLRAPTALQQQVYFSMAKSGLPHDILTNVMRYF